VVPLPPLRGVLKLSHGLAQLARGCIDQARALWRQALADEPDARLVRVQLRMPDDLLDRMRRRPGPNRA